MALDSTQPLTEMSTSNLHLGGGVKDGRRVRLITLQPSMSRLSSRCGSLDLSHTYGPSRPVTGIAFTANKQLRGLNVVQPAENLGTFVSPLSIVVTFYIFWNKSLPFSNTKLHVRISF
jgi:hypothetical protein